MVLLFKEAYIDLTMCAVLQHYSIKRNPELNFYDTLPDAISSILAYFTLSQYPSLLPSFLHLLQSCLRLQKNSNPKIWRKIRLEKAAKHQYDQRPLLRLLGGSAQRWLLIVDLHVYFLWAKAFVHMDGSSFTTNQEHVYFQVVPLVAMSVANMMYIIGRRPFI